VCNVAAWSALLQNEPLVGRILDAVVAAVAVPVTLKIRTGWAPERRNALSVAKLAESAGISAISIHGRTRACGFNGSAEYDTIAAVKSAVRIPVIANGDIDSPQKAREVLHRTGADALMIGRAAPGRPWIFREIQHFLDTGESLPPPQVEEIHQVLIQHLRELHAFYGEPAGVRIARKHISWYTKALAGAGTFRQAMNGLDSAPQQLEAVDDYFAGLARLGAQLNYIEELAA
jgi:tRNA-dihydrouridine synthase B